MSKGNSVIVRGEQVAWKVQKVKVLGNSVLQCFIQVWNKCPVSLPYMFLPIFASLLWLAAHPGFGFPCFLLNALAMKVLLLIDFMRSR